MSDTLEEGQAVVALVAPGRRRADQTPAARKCNTLHDFAGHDPDFAQHAGNNDIVSHIRLAVFCVYV
jgi:hypothetical protein